MIFANIIIDLCWSYTKICWSYYEPKKYDFIELYRLETLNRDFIGLAILYIAIYIPPVTVSLSIDVH